MGHHLLHDVDNQWLGVSESSCDTSSAPTTLQPAGYQGSDQLPSQSQADSSANEKTNISSANKKANKKTNDEEANCKGGQA